MGKWKENPRYNVLSVRVSDGELSRIREQSGNGTMQGFLHCAIMFAVREWENREHDSDRA